MKKILLIGDSIRKAYDYEVAKVFEGTAEVRFPEDNCRTTVYILRGITDWKTAAFGDEAPDVIHWNAGLWDVLQLFGEEPQIPHELYRYFLERIFKRLVRLYPETKIVFALSTPIVEERYTDPNVMRRNSLIREYNVIASEVAAKYGAEVDDLYSVAEQFPAEWYTDSTHPYSDMGRYKLAEAVTKCLSDVLGIDAPAVPEDISRQVGRQQA